jgi:CBS domain-containing protein
MIIKNILERKGSAVITIGVFESVSDAIDTMSERHIAALVLTNGERILGLVSERDILRAISKDGIGVLNSPIGHIANNSLVTVEPEETIERVMRLMTHSRVRHLPVMEKDQLVGIVSVGDIVKYRLEELELESNVLRDLAVAVR